MVAWVSQPPPCQRALGDSAQSFVLHLRPTAPAIHGALRPSARPSVRPSVRPSHSAWLNATDQTRAAGTITDKEIECCLTIAAELSATVAVAWLGPFVHADTDAAGLYVVFTLPALPPSSFCGYLELRGRQLFPDWQHVGASVMTQQHQRLLHWGDVAATPEQITAALLLASQPTANGLRYNDDFLKLLLPQLKSALELKNANQQPLNVIDAATIPALARAINDRASLEETEERSILALVHDLHGAHEWERASRKRQCDVCLELNAMTCPCGRQQCLACVHHAERTHQLERLDEASLSCSRRGCSRPVLLECCTCKWRLCLYHQHSSNQTHAWLPAGRLLQCAGCHRTDLDGFACSCGEARCEVCTLPLEAPGRPLWFWDPSSARLPVFVAVVELDHEAKVKELRCLLGLSADFHEFATTFKQLYGYLYEQGLRQAILECDALYRQSEVRVEQRMTPDERTAFDRVFDPSAPNRCQECALPFKACLARPAVEAARPAVKTPKGVLELKGCTDLQALKFLNASAARFCSPECQAAGSLVVCEQCGLSDMLEDQTCRRCWRSEPVLPPPPIELELQIIRKTKRQLQPHWQALQSLTSSLGATDLELLLQAIVPSPDSVDETFETFETDIIKHLSAWKLERQQRRRDDAPGVMSEALQLLAKMQRIHAPADEALEQLSFYKQDDSLLDAAYKEHAEDLAWRKATFRQSDQRGRVSGKRDPAHVPAWKRSWLASCAE